MPSINWGDALESADGSDFELLPRADYNFKVTEASHKVSSTGKDMFEMKCTVVDGPHKGRVLYSNQVVSPDNPTAMGIFFRKMGALGLKADFFRANPENSAIVDAILGREFQGQVTVRTYQGNDKNEISNIRPAVRTPGSAASPPPPPTAGGVPPLPSAPPGSSF